MQEIKIYAELSKDDRAKLDQISELLTRFLNHVKGSEPPIEPVTPNVELSYSEQELEAPGPEITKEMIQKRVVAISAKNPDKKPEIKNLITKYAERVSAIPEEAYNEVWEQLNALEG